MAENNVFISIPESANYQLPDAGLLQYYKDLDNRAYSLIGEVDDNLLDFVSKIIEWNREDRGKPTEERTPIKFFINSPGGNLDTYETVRDIIALSKTPIIAINMGCAYSAAALLFLECPKRYMLPSATLLLHLGAASLSGSYREMEAATKQYQQQVQEFVERVGKKTNYDKKEIEENISTDWYISADEAVEHGAADKIVEDIDELL